jgi:uncharacterized membrane protein
VLQLAVRVPWAVAAGLWLSGLALVALSVAQGGATVSLVVIVPVVSGASATFIAGVVLILAGFVALMFSFSEPWEGPPLSTPTRGAGIDDSPPSGGASGFVLIGPVPIFFGSWRTIPRRQRWWFVLAGAVTLIVVVLAAVWLLR